MAYSQKGRMCVLETPLGTDVLIPVNVTAVESVSELFRIDLSLISHEGEITFESIIGKSVTVELRSGDDESRFFNGIVSRFSQGGTYHAGGEDADLVSYQAEVVPWLWRLTRNTNCRVWEDKSVIEILKDVLGDPRYGDAPYEFSNLFEDYEPIEYCVQYRETDFNFVSRMMEEEGLFYSFRHEKGKHTMVISDISSSCPDCPGHETLTYVRSTESAVSVKQVENWSVQQVMPPGKYALDGYDFTNPSEDLLASTQTTISMGGNAHLEVFDVPTNYFACKDGSRYAKFRMEAEEAASHQARAQSICGGLTAGNHITLMGHYCEAYNHKRYFITSVQHYVSESGGHAGVGPESSYENSFTCLPEKIPFRPMQTRPKPSIGGTQTALVVGPSGEEIYCDKYGRVRIQFYWDRNGPNDGTAVCWARVAQNSAGTHWGSIFIPRIGQEVVVTFLDGDPDRPLITGVVYNAEQMPPYELPAHKTQSGVKTRSSLNGTATNFNELRFEDKKGSEEVYVHAEKDMNEVVENDRTRQVGNDESVRIGHDRTVDVEANHKETVGGDEELAVSGSRSRTVGDTEAVKVTKGQTISVDDTRSLNVGKDVTDTFAESWKVQVGKDVDEEIGANYTGSVAKNYGLRAKKTQLVADDELSIVVGSAKLVMKKNGDVTLNGKKISLKGSGDVTVKGTKIREN